MKRRSTKTKLLTALLTLCMLLSLVPMAAMAAETTVQTASQLEAALENADCAEIKLGGNIETAEELAVNRTVMLDLNGYTLTCSATDESIFRVRSSGSLTVKDSGTDGKINGQNKNCAVEVKGGTLTLESGSIVNCTDADGDGGAVDVASTGVTETPIRYGKFVMNGGAIMDCKAGDDGGAVDIGSGCTFIMNGGRIENCRAEDDGGAVFIKQSGTFELNGGVIQNCSAGANGGAVNIYQDGHFTMTGGTIKDCKVDLGGYGIAVYGEDDKAIVSISGGTIENCGVKPWHFDAYTVTFDSDGGSAVPEQKLLNSPAVKPADPKKDGYDFAGWYLEDTPYAFDTKVTENITLKAHWTPVATPNTISAAAIENVKLDYRQGDAPQATAQVAAAGDQYTILYECWGRIEPAAGSAGEATAYWYSDDGYHPTGYAYLTAFDQNEQYRYSVRLEAKDGFIFSGDISMKNIVLNGKSLPSGSEVLVLDNGKTCLVTYGTMIIPGGGSVQHNHSYGAKWKYDETAHWHQCACGATTDQAAHTFKWVTDREATESENGAKHEECTVCGYKKPAVVIPATGQKVEPSRQNTKSVPHTAKSGKETVSPQTGKADRWILELPLLVAGIALAAGAVYTGRKRKKQNA